jgi:hypothetical protein
MLDAESNVRVLVEGPLAGRTDVGCFERNRLIAVGLRHLHAAIPHAMIHVAAPEENQAGFQLLFLGNKRRVASCGYSILCSFRVDPSCKPLILRGCADFVWNMMENYVLYF